MKLANSDLRGQSIYIVILVQSLKEPVSDLVNGWRLHGVRASGAATKHNQPLGSAHLMTWKGSDSFALHFFHLQLDFSLGQDQLERVMWRGKKICFYFSLFRRSVRRGETTIPNWRFGTQSQIRMCALASRNEGEERDDDFQAGCSVLGLFGAVADSLAAKIKNSTCVLTRKNSWIFLLCFCFVFRGKNEAQKDAGKFKIFYLFRTFLIDNDIHWRIDSTIISSFIFAMKSCFRGVKSSFFAFEQCPRRSFNHVIHGGECFASLFKCFKQLMKSIIIDPSIPFPIDFELFVSD